MAIFSDLAVEIVYEIISYLHSLRDLTALGLSCRGLSEIVELENRRRFHTITINSIRSDLFSKLRDMDKSPRLRSYVRQLKVRSMIPVPDEFYLPTNCDYLLPHFEAAGLSKKDCKMIYPNEPFSLLRDTGLYYRFLAEWIAVVFIVMSPNLRTLTFDAPLGINSPLRHFLCRINHADPGTLERKRLLRELQCVGFGPGANTSSTADALFHFLNIPTIRHCYMSLTRDVLHRSSGTGWRMPFIRSIKLRLAPSISTSEVMRIICHCKRLEQFAAKGGHFDSSLLMKALLGHKDTLKTLDLFDSTAFSRKRRRVSNSDFCLNYPEVLPLLNQMVALKELRLDTHMMLGFKETVNKYPPPQGFKLKGSLPPNITTFYFKQSFRRCKFHEEKLSEFLREVNLRGNSWRNIGTSVRPSFVHSFSALRL